MATALTQKLAAMRQEAACIERGIRGYLCTEEHLSADDKAQAEVTLRLAVGLRRTLAKWLVAKDPTAAA